MSLRDELRQGEDGAEQVADALDAFDGLGGGEAREPLVALGDRGLERLVATAIRERAGDTYILALFRLDPVLGPPVSRVFIRGLEVSLRVVGALSSAGR